MYQGGFTFITKGFSLTRLHIHKNIKQSGDFCAYHMRAPGPFPNLSYANFTIKQVKLA